MKAVELVPIDQSGNVAVPAPLRSEVMKENCDAVASFYRLAGFEVPWICYISLADGRHVGGGGFKGPPRGDRFEIAYYTLPEFEGQDSRLVHHSAGRDQRARANGVVWPGGA